MSNPNAVAAADAPMKTPGYAWPCLIVSLLCAVSIVFAWQWLPGVTFPVFSGWEAGINPTFQAPMMANVMGLVPIGALIMAFPTSILVRKWGPKMATCTGMILAIIGQVICSVFAATDFMVFLAGRFILGLGLSTTVVAGPTCVSVWFPHGTRGRAMAIWSTWAPIGIFTINAISSSVLGAVGGDMTMFLWIWAIVMVVILVLFFLVFLFNNGTEALLPGLLAVIPGALLVALMAICGKQVDITVVQRWLLVITVLSCLLLPFSDGVLQLGCACLVVAAWAAFKTTNYAFVVRKSTLTRSTPLFRQAPMRLFVSSLGFAVGWGIAAVITNVSGAHSEPFTVVRLAMVFVLVMAFFPIGRHHLADGTSRDEGALNADKVVVQMDESELFEERCQAIVKLYQLSPREADILAYLAKGRNAAWIQEELTISPHTVKSHIYNIYRKLDIHSQQKLMSFVEEFPLDL